MLSALSLKQRVDRFYGVSPASDQTGAAGPETEMHDISAEIRGAEPEGKPEDGPAAAAEEEEGSDGPEEADGAEMQDISADAAEPSMRRCARHRDWAYFECAERCCCCCPSALPSVAYTQLEPPATKCLQCLCCGASPSFGGADAWSGAVNRMAGVIYAGGLAVLMDCWLANQPEAIDALTVTAAHLAMLLLNSVDPKVVVASDAGTRRKAAILLSFSYMVMFVALARSFWRPTQYAAATTTTTPATPAQPPVNPCGGVQAVHCIVLITVATTLRFAGHLFGTLWESGGSSYADQVRIGAGGGTPPPWVSVVMAVVAAMSFVGGLTAHSVAMFGPDGGDGALYVPPVYILPTPLLLVIRLKVRGGGRRGVDSAAGIVWRTWHAFVPTVVYCMCVLWPLVLYSNRMLTRRQAWFSVVGACGVVLAGRIGMATLDQVTQANGGGGWGAGAW